TPQGIRVVWIAPNSLRVTDEQGSECAALSSRLFSGLLEWAWVNPQRGDVLVVTVDEHQNVLVIDEAGRIRLRANGKMKGSVRTVAVSPDSSRLAVFWANDDFLGVFELFGPASPEAYARCVGHTNLVHSLTFSPGGKQIVSASEDGTARLWDARTGAAT